MLFLAVAVFAAEEDVLLFCASALPAADFELSLVRPSRNVFEAALAAVADVSFLGALVCERALPAAVLDALLVDLSFRVFEALDAEVLPVTFLFVTVTPIGVG